MLHRVGFELRRFSVEQSENARFISMLRTHNVNLIFDVGANAGQFGVLLREIGFDGKIVSFEPLSDARESLQNISRNDPLWQIALQTAIGEENGEIEIQIAGNSQSSSVLVQRLRYIDTIWHNNGILFSMINFLWRIIWLIRRNTLSS